MYDVTPVARDAWRKLFERAARIAGIDLTVVEHAAPAPLETLWSRDDMGCVFMCGWPFSLAHPRPQIVAAPVPRGARYNGLPIYFTDFLAREDRGFVSLADTFGGRIAWTVAGSHSGFNAPRHHLLRYRSGQRPVLYPESVGPVVTPAGALESVLRGDADVAPLDSYALELIRRHEPERLAQTQVLESTAPSPIPPLVASPDVDRETVKALRTTLLAAHVTPAFSELLATLELSGFALPPTTDYDTVSARDVEARERGYPYPA